ncbi:protein ABHD14A-like isoform X2 [Mobula birostris]|uniref:protein ABHD14A-like isoform X2 n=1 Tax=Mobula birostris TaxID=1983395 RepID=UPI003B284079
MVCCLPGARVWDVSDQVHDILVQEGKQPEVVIHVGTNDIGRKKDEVLKCEFRELGRRLKNRTSRVAFSGLLPVLHDSDGFGNTSPLEVGKTDKDRADFLLTLMNAVGLQTPVLISPSMSGRFSIPFVMFHNQRLKGFVPVAPIGTNAYSAEQYQKIQTPTLIVFGEQDTNLGVQSLKNLRHLPHHNIIKIPTAHHACYLDEPKKFHDALLDFLTKLQ